MNDTTYKLKSAIFAIQSNQPEFARNILKELLTKEPKNLDVLMWACEVADTRVEKIGYLKRILAINPSDSCAQTCLEELGSSTAHPINSKINPVDEKKKQTSPINWLVVSTQLLIFVVAFSLVIYVGYSVYNGILPGHSSIFSQEISISETFDQLNSDKLEWQIIYENKNETTFSGQVRHTSRINISKLPLLTHDILVTFGDFSDPELVTTHVNNHHFRWFTNQTIRPKGTINLLHTVPANKEILKQLESIHLGDEVEIKGKEILAIKVYDSNGAYIAEWSDSGCNTLLVNSVSNQK